MTSHKIDLLRREFEKGSPLRMKDMRTRGIGSAFFSILERRGEIVRLAPGFYVSASATASETAGYEWIAQICPFGVFCLFSALRLHGLTTENPHRCHVALPPGARKPKTDLPCEFWRFGSAVYGAGVERITRNGVELRVYDVEKTIVDCFRYRKKIGPDVAVAAIREGFEKGRIDRTKLWEYAKASRMLRVMRDFMEAWS